MKQKIFKAIWSIMYQWMNVQWTKVHYKKSFINNRLINLYYKNKGNILIARLFPTDHGYHDRKAMVDE